MIRAFKRLEESQTKAKYTFCNGKLPKKGELALKSIIKQSLKISGFIDS